MVPLISAPWVPGPCSSLQMALPCTQFPELLFAAVPPCPHSPLPSAAWIPLLHVTSVHPSVTNRSRATVISPLDSPAAPWGVSRFPSVPPTPNPFSSVREFSYLLLARSRPKPFNSFSMHLERGSANYSPRIKPSQPPVFVNKLLLEHRHAHLCSFIQLPSHHNGRVQ